MNGALLAVRPRFAQGIVSGVKTIELRRRAPMCAPGDLVVVYETSPTKAIVGFAIIRRIDDGSTERIWRTTRGAAGVSREEYHRYFEGASHGAAIHLEGAKAFRHPIALGEAVKLAPGFRPPQSWCYLHSLPKALANRLRHALTKA